MLSKIEKLIHRRYHKNIKTFLLMFLLFSSIIYYTWILKKYQNVRENKRSNYENHEDQLFFDPIKLVVTCCGQEVVEQLLVMMKSAIIFTNSYLHFIIISDVKETIIETITQWPKIYQDKLKYEFILPSFPNVSNPQEWKNAYQPCSAQRLFVHLLLPNHDAVIYLDTDIVFLSPPEEIWSLFKQMNSIQIAGYAVDSYEPINAGYSNNTKFPFASKFGLNAGIVAMNLTRMRQVGYLDEIHTIVDEWGDEFKIFDQDIINVYFYNHPERYLLLPCRFNYHPVQCLQTNWCESAEKESICILHGFGITFDLNSWLPSFRMVYESFMNYELGTDLNQNVLKPLKHRLEHANITHHDKSSCPKIIIKSL